MCRTQEMGDTRLLRFRIDSEQSLQIFADGFHIRLLRCLDGRLKLCQFGCKSAFRMAETMNPAFAGEIRSASAPPLFTSAAPLPIPRCETGEQMLGDMLYDWKFLLICFLKLYADNRTVERKLPQVLELAVREMQRTENLRIGIDALTGLTHYSRTHLARLIHQHYGMVDGEIISKKFLRCASCFVILGIFFFSQIAIASCNNFQNSNN